MGTNLAVIETTLTDHLPSIEQAAAEALDPQRLVRTMLTTIQQGPTSEKLAACTPESVLLACLNAAYLGLEPTGFLGDAYLIPYGRTCNLQIGYKGLIKLMKRTGEVARVEAHEVWDADLFAYQYGTDPKIEHRPGLHTDRSEMIAAYAVAWMRDGETQFEVMTPDEIAAVKSKSRGATHNDSPWVQFPAMMWRKSAVRRLANYVELSAEARVGLAYDDQATIGNTISVTEVSPDSYETNEQARIATAAKVEDVRGQLTAATGLAKAKAEVGAAVEAAGWPKECIPHFVQTVHGDGTRSVDWRSLSVEEWGEVEKRIWKARELRDGGEDVQLTRNDDPSQVYVLPSFATREG